MNVLTRKIGEGKQRTQEKKGAGRRLTLYVRAVCD